MWLLPGNKSDDSFNFYLQNSGGNQALGRLSGIKVTVLYKRGIALF